MPSFAESLNKRASDIKAPPVMPAGMYLGVVTGPYKNIKAKTGTEGAEFTIALQQPISDVDATQLAEAGGAQGKTMAVRLYSEYFIKQFLVDHLGLEEGNKTLGELLSEAPGKSVGVIVVNKPSAKGDRMTSFIESTTKV